MSDLTIRTATLDDAAEIWAMLEPVFRRGDTYAIDRDIIQGDAIAYWMSAEKRTFVAEAGGKIIGTYHLQRNQAGGGAHICNCGYVTAAQATGRGVARQMCLHSLNLATELGFRGMQFNFVVSSNVRAVGLWQSLGFEIVGRLPRAFYHPEEGYVDALIMFKSI